MLLCLRCLLSFQKINEKPQVIADYESGRAIPNNQVMGKIERAIGKLRETLETLPVFGGVVWGKVFSFFQ